MSEHESVERLEQLLRRLEEARVRLEATEEPEDAVAILAELGSLAGEVQAEVERARREGSDPLA